MARYPGLNDAQTSALSAIARFAREHDLGREITLRLAEDHILVNSGAADPNWQPLPHRPDTVHALVRLGTLVHRDGHVNRRYWLTGRALDCLNYTDLSPFGRLCCDMRNAVIRTLRLRGRLLLGMAILVALAVILLALSGRLPIVG